MLRQFFDERFYRIIRFLFECGFYSCFSRPLCRIYRRDFLLEFCKLPQSYLEKTEKLEQLRALENGYKIKVVKTNYVSIGIDTPQDLERLKTSR